MGEVVQVQLCMVEVLRSAATMATATMQKAFSEEGAQYETE